MTNLKALNKNPELCSVVKLSFLISKYVLLVAISLVAFYYVPFIPYAAPMLFLITSIGITSYLLFTKTEAINIQIFYQRLVNGEDRSVLGSMALCSILFSLPISFYIQYSTVLVDGSLRNFQELLTNTLGLVSGFLIWFFGCILFKSSIGILTYLSQKYSEFLKECQTISND